MAPPPLLMRRLTGVGSPPPSVIFTIGILALVYYVTGRLGLSLASVHPSATAIWAPAGIALAALMLWGYRVWPGIFLGAFLANVTTTPVFFTSLGIATGNTLSGVFGAWLVNRLANGRQTFDRVRHVFLFSFLAGMVSTTVSATFGVISLCMGGQADWSGFNAIWFTWWLGDAAGNLIVAPLLILWGVDPRAHWSAARLLEGMLILLVVLLVGLAVFSRVFPFNLHNYPVLFLFLPILMWTAFRFGQRETATVNFMLAGIAIWGTTHGVGPFVRQSPNESLIFLQAFMGLLLVTQLGLAAVIGERKLAEQELRESRDELDQRVHKRTIELATANQALQASQKLLAEAQQISHIGSWEWDVASNRMSWSDELYRVHGLKPQEHLITYEMFLQYVHPDDRQLVREILEKARHDHQPFGFNHRIFRPDGAERLLGVRGEVIVDGGGQAIRLVGTGQDVTEQRKAEEELAERRIALERSNAELGKFAHVVSHDLQEPLRMIRSYTQILEKRYNGKLDADADIFIRFVVDGAARMQKMVRDLLYYSEVGQRKRLLELTDCATILNRTLSNLQAAIDESHAVVTHDPLPMVAVDPTELTQLLQNLLSNAIKFHGDKPPKVHVSARASTKVRVGPAQRLTRGWMFSVRDSGIGIEPQYFNRIFEVFQRLHGPAEYPGTGIGLAICKKIVDEYGGRIWVESEVGKGSCFNFTIPVQLNSSHERT